MERGTAVDGRITASATRCAQHQHPIITRCYCQTIFSRTAGQHVFAVAGGCHPAGENLCLGHKLSEYHTGYRVYARRVLDEIDFDSFSDDFVFDNQMLAQIIHAGFSIGEVSCPAAYFEDASSINFQRSVTYGLGVLATSVQLFLQRKGLAEFPIFDPAGRKLPAVSGG